jgi:hypothetical protein
MMVAMVERSRNQKPETRNIIEENIKKYKNDSSYY